MHATCYFLMMPHRAAGRPPLLERKTARMQPVTSDDALRQAPSGLPGQKERRAPVQAGVVQQCGVHVHLRVQPGVARDQACQLAIVHVRPVHPGAVGELI